MPSCSPSSSACVSEALDPTPAPGSRAASPPDRWRRFFLDLCAARHADLIQLGPGALGNPWPGAPWPANVLIFADDPALIPPGDDRVVADLPLAAGPGAPRIALAVAGGAPGPAVVETLAAITAASQRRTPTAPVPPEVGRLLHVLARCGGRKQVLDVGTGAGASALWLGAAMALVGGRVTTVERDAARHTEAKKNLRRAGLERRVEPRLGELERLAPKLGGPFDLIFLDEAPEDRADDLHLLLPLCARGALVISHAGTAGPAALAQVNALVQLDPRIRAALRLPVGGGVTVAVVGGRREERDARELEILNRGADRWNEAMADFLLDQADL